MSQHDFALANQTTPAFRTDLNNALLALASINAGATEPGTLFANMLWYDTALTLLKMRNEGNDAWITLGKMNQSTDLFEPAIAGVLASTAEAQAGTDNTKLMSPLKTKEAIDSLSGWVHLDRQVASASAQLDFTAFNSAKFDAYKFIGANVEGATDLQSLLGQVSINGGSSFISTGYSRVGLGWTTDGAGGGSEVTKNLDGSGSIISQISGQPQGNAANEDGASFEITIYGPHLAEATVVHTQSFCWNDTPFSDQEQTQYDEWGTDNQTTEVDAFRFAFDIGNIASGVIDMFGLPNA